MKNKTVKLILAVIVLGVLTGGYFGVKSYVADQETAEEEKEEEKTDVFETETSNIKSLKFMIEEKEVTFLKENDLWVKDDEKDFPVNQDTLDSAASSVSSVEAERVLEDVEDLSEYGLDVPNNTITISSEDGERTVLRIGMKNDSTSQYYVGKDDDKNTVYVVAEATVSPFMNSLYDYAEMQTFPSIDASSVSKITVEQTDKSYEVLKDEETGLWSVVNGDESEKADSSRISSLTSSLGSMEYETFADYNCTDKSKYGLDVPYATVTVSYEEEVEDDQTEDVEETSETSEEETEPEMIEKEIVLLIGAEAETDSRYVMIDGSNEVYTMTKDLLSTVIDKEVSTLWDMTVNYISLNNLDSLDVKMNGEVKSIDVSRETIVVEDEEEESSTNDTDADTEDKDDGSGDSSENSESEDDDPQTETIVTYKIDGEAIDDIDFTTFYNKLINLAGQKRLTEKYNPDKEPEMSVVFHKIDNSSANVDFYEYDVNYYAAVVDNKVFLFNKMTYKELRSSYESLVSENEENAGEGENSIEENDGEDENSIEENAGEESAAEEN